MNKVLLYWYLLKYLGLQWLLYRLGYVIRIRTGWVRRRLPFAPWDEQPLQQFLTDTSLAHPPTYLSWRKNSAPKFLFDPSDRGFYQVFFERWDRDEKIPGYNNPCQDAESLNQGIVRYFSHMDSHASHPPDWHKNPFTGQTLPSDLHWSQIDDFGYGDIKVIWDLNRFGFVFTLVRAHWRCRDEKYPQLFWELVEDWREHNPPQLGANWKCGQEISLRVMAWCFGLYGFLDSPATTAERVAMLTQMIAVSGVRIEANIQQALHQNNNHGVSEGMGLWTIGLLFPELRDSLRWLRIGKEILENLGQALFYEDGTFAQHSANYQRFVLHDYLWAIQLGFRNGHTFQPQLLNRLHQAAILLYQIQDAASGQVPCFGHNDGSLILPLNNAGYQDYRPVIQALVYLTTHTRLYPDGAWDEDLLWLFGSQALESGRHLPPRQDLQAKQGGYSVIRSETGHAFITCTAYSHRPAHADQLNVDLWWLGQNITLDPGTYSYNAPPPWDHPLSRTAYHNAVTVDGRDQMAQVGRFLWLPWADGKVTHSQRSLKGRLAYWEGTHTGYLRLPGRVSLRRGVLFIGPDHWLILDWCHSAFEHDYRLHWLLPDVPYVWHEQARHLTLETPAGSYYICTSSVGNPACSLIRAAPDSPRGWVAPYYYDRQPALSLDCAVKAKSILFWSLFGPQPARLVWDQASLQVACADWHSEIAFSSTAGDGQLLAVSWEGKPNAQPASDQLDIHVHSSRRSPKA